MGLIQQIPDHPITGGFYTVREASRLLRIDSTVRMKGWLDGYPKAQVGPIIKRQYTRLSQGRQTIGFLDLLEMRFVEHFRTLNISLQSLRKAASNARRELKQDHPFATSNVKFMTDRKRVFLATAKEEGDTFLLNLMTNQIEMYTTIEQVLAKPLTFDPQTGVAYRWKPAPEFDSVVIDRRIAFGQPIIEPHNIPTKAIFSMWRAEGNYAAVEKWFGVPEKIARQAVEFELSLPG